MTAATHQTTFSTPTPTEVVATRMYDVPRELVWAALTDPRHVTRWLLGPDGWTMPICEIDLRVGGAWRYGWQNAEDGQAFEISGHYLEIEAPSRVVFTEHFEDKPESVTSIELVEAEGRTTMTCTMRYVSEEVRDAVLATGMTSGAETSYERLAGVLASLA